jgi:hypothetical protein
MSSDFLQFTRSQTASSLSTETKIIQTLGAMNQCYLLCFKNEDYLQKHFSQLMHHVAELKASEICMFNLSDDISFIRFDGDRNDYSKDDLFNEAINWSREHSCTCVAFYYGANGFFTNGNIDTKYNSILEEYRTLADKLNRLFKVQDLALAFDQFRIENKRLVCQCECEINGEFISIFDNTSGKINAFINEQHLRNVLYRFLKTNVRGETTFEFATNPHNDEESVDLRVIDGTAGAIIEVKFAFTQDHYLGSTFYSFKTRIKDGYGQLDKYCTHLQAYQEKIQYAYLYMFHTQDKTCDELVHSSQTIYETVKDSYSASLRSLYSGTEIDDVKLWKKR